MAQNVHHIIAKSDNGSNHPDNMVVMDVKEHRNVHNLFGIDRPHEQIMKILEISHTAWLDSRLQAIDSLLRAFKGEYYKKTCFRPDGINFTKRGDIFIPE